MKVNCVVWLIVAAARPNPFGGGGGGGGGGISGGLLASIQVSFTN